MYVEIVNVYKESFPAVKLVGKCYTNADRDEMGTFACYWQQAYREGWFEKLRQCKCIPNVSEDDLGVMHVTEQGGGFAYWIGIFLALDAEVPDGFASVELPAGEVGVCWLCGNAENGELYHAKASDRCMEAMLQKGWHFSHNGWFFERYHCPRFTKPDEKGNVILDICAFLD